MVPKEQEPDSPLGVAITMPVGSVSLKAIPVRDELLLLVMVKVRVELALGLIVVGLKAMEIVGGDSTVSAAEAVVPLTPCVSVSVPVVLV